jgi:hypothetical protein
MSTIKTINLIHPSGSTTTEDYPEFQAWLAEGNEPLPPDEETN